MIWFSILYADWLDESGDFEMDYNIVKWTGSGKGCCGGGGEFKWQRIAKHYFLYLQWSGIK